MRGWAFVLRAFAPLREKNQAAPRAVSVQMVHAKAQRREGESGDFEENPPFKKHRKSQEVDTESVYSLSPHDVKKQRNQSPTATQ